MIHELKPLALIFLPLFSPDAFLFLQEEIKGLSNVEKVLLDTADSVMDTKKKLEFGVQQIIFKVRAFSNFSCMFLLNPNIFFQFEL